MSDQDHSNLEGDAEERAGAGDPASSHGSDLDARMGVDAEAEGDAEERTGLGHSRSVRDGQPDQTMGAEEAGP